MLYEIDRESIKEKPIEEAVPDDLHQYAGFFRYAEGKIALQKFQFNEFLLDEFTKTTAMAFENHEGYDFLCVHIPDHKTIFSHDKIIIYFNKNVLLFLCENESLLEKINRIVIDEKNPNPAFDRLLYTFFEKLTIFNVEFFNRFELEIADLENALIKSQNRPFIKEIVSLRKRLMALKRHYEQLLDLLDDLQENENDLLNSSSLRYFKIFSSKAERHYHNILNLRDYVTQVREAYQSEVDINLNGIMKIFTVITAIFLPLTLIVGWYGMNLKMPEYGWPYAYPAVIVISILVVLLCFIYFKKNKWF